jgi:DNA-binding protein HU-beta
LALQGKTDFLERFQATNSATTVLESTLYTLMEHPMNKTELVDAIAKDCELSKVAAQRALESVLDHVVKTVTNGDSVQLVGFGTFASGNRAERIGRNPRTGEDITIAAAKTVKFSAGKAFKDALNKK